MLDLSKIEYHVDKAPNGGVRVSAVLRIMSVRSCSKNYANLMKRQLREAIWHFVYQDLVRSVVECMVKVDEAVHENLYLRVEDPDKNPAKVAVRRLISLLKVPDDQG